ncbi:unnamed protein product [Orchesella dallaii]|uniref:F5/8 type C domain-containing protein n=1 Tax=Orchesella dallaii TaxID=48710 RepID=A0ABP1QV72_9HEXA
MRSLTVKLIPISVNLTLIFSTANCLLENYCYIFVIIGETRGYDWDSGYTCHQLGSGAIVVQLAQPYVISSMRLLLWDCDDRSYSYYIEVSTNQRHWEMVCNRSRENCKSWQAIRFDPIPVVYIRIVGTNNSANEVFHCVHFECPSQSEDDLTDQPETSATATGTSTNTTTKTEVPSTSRSSTTPTSTSPPTVSKDTPSRRSIGNALAELLNENDDSVETDDDGARSPKLVERSDSTEELFE